MIIVLALVFTLVSFLVPTRVVGYSDSTIIVYDHESDDVSLDSHTSCVYVEVKQTLWQRFAAFAYVGLDWDDEDDTNKMVRIRTEYGAAVSAAKSAARQKAEYMPYLDDEYLEMLYYRYLEDELSARLSKINFTAFMLVDSMPLYMDKSYEVSLEHGDSGVYASTVATLIMQTVSGLIGIAVGVLSLVALAFAIVGMITKKQKVNLYKYLTLVSLLSGIALIVSALAPMGKGGGAAYASFLVAAIAMIVCGTTCSIVTRSAGVGTIVRRAVIATVLTVGVPLLFANSVTLRTAVETTANFGSSGASSITNLKMPIGRPLVHALTQLLLRANGVELATDMSGFIASGIITYLLGAATVAIATLTWRAAVCGCIGKESRHMNKLLLATWLTALGYIIITGAVTHALYDMLVEDAEIGRDITMSFWVRAQAYFTAFMSMGAFIFAKAFKPKKKQGATISMDGGAAEESDELKNTRP